MKYWPFLFIASLAFFLHFWSASLVCCWLHKRTEGREIERRSILHGTCNALNLGVEFFSSFPSPNSGVTLSFSLFSSLNLDLFQSYSGIRLEISCKAIP